MIALVVLALACAAGTVTLCQSKIAAPLRRVLGRTKFVRELISCMYCASFWVALPLVITTRPDVLGEPWAEIPVDLLAVVTLASPLMYLINWAHNSMDWGEQ